MDAKMSAKIQGHGHASWECKQSRHGHLPKLPARGILVAPSQQFKSACLADLILRHYRGCFERIFVFSPSVDIDSVWDAVKGVRARGHESAGQREMFLS